MIIRWNKITMHYSGVFVSDKDYIVQEYFYLISLVTESNNLLKIHRVITWGSNWVQLKPTHVLYYALRGNQLKWQHCVENGPTSNTLCLTQTQKILPCRSILGFFGQGGGEGSPMRGLELYRYIYTVPGLSFVNCF